LIEESEQNGSISVYLFISEDNATLSMSACIIWQLIQVDMWQFLGRHS